MFLFQSIILPQYLYCSYIAVNNNAGQLLSLIVNEVVVTSPGEYRNCIQSKLSNQDYVLNLTTSNRSIYILKKK